MAASSAGGGSATSTTADNSTTTADNSTTTADNSTTPVDNTTAADNTAATGNSTSNPSTSTGGTSGVSNSNQHRNLSGDSNMNRSEGINLDVASEWCMDKSMLTHKIIPDHAFNSILEVIHSMQDEQSQSNSLLKEAEKKKIFSYIQFYFTICGTKHSPDGEKTVTNFGIRTKKRHFEVNQDFFEKLMDECLNRVETIETQQSGFILHRVTKFEIVFLCADAFFISSSNSFIFLSTKARAFLFLHCPGSSSMPTSLRLDGLDIKALKPGA